MKVYVVTATTWNGVREQRIGTVAICGTEEKAREWVSSSTHFLTYDYEEWDVT